MNIQRWVHNQSAGCGWGVDAIPHCGALMSVRALICIDWHVLRRHWQHVGSCASLILLLQFLAYGSPMV